MGDRVVVKEGRMQWRADSGQYLLAFEGNPADGTLSVIAPAEEDSDPNAEELFERAVAIEREDPKAAIDAYERAIEADPGYVDAYVNLGSLLHETRRLMRAERVYRKALETNGSEPILLYNLGVLLEDLGRSEEAIEAYEAALRGDPHMADCHYNLALLCEMLEKPREAIQHMARYRKLTSK